MIGTLRSLEAPELKVAVGDEGKARLAARAAADPEIEPVITQILGKLAPQP